MTTPVSSRFGDEELAVIDQLVRDGVGENRSAVIRLGVQHLADSVRRAEVAREIADSYREPPQDQTDDDLAMANAMAVTEAEPW